VLHQLPWMSLQLSEQQSICELALSPRARR